MRNSNRFFILVVLLLGGVLLAEIGVGVAHWPARRPTPTQLAAATPFTATPTLRPPTPTEPAAPAVTATIALPPATVTLPPAAGPLPVGALALDFALPREDGTTVRLSDYRDKQSVVLVFYRGQT